MLRFVLSFFLLIGLILPASGQPSRIDPLYQALGLSEIVAVMREEGIGYGGELEDDLFPSRGGARWAAMIEQIYDPVRMEEVLRQGLDKELANVELDAMVGFFSTDRGKRIVALEVSARRALLDDGVDEASRAKLDDMILARDPRLDLVRAFAAANDLVESNVVGAMNSNFAFYIGLADGGAFGNDLTEEQILTDVWSQEEAIRDDTEEWLYSYLALAYQPLSDADLEAYIAFSETEAGSDLNRALFEAFDEMFTAISTALGLAASTFISGEEL